MGGKAPSLPPSLTKFSLFFLPFQSDYLYAGHDHDGGYICDHKGIHHRTFESSMQAPIGDNAFATVEVFEGAIEIKGEGTIKSAKYEL